MNNQNFLEELADKIYRYLVEEMNCTKEELETAIVEHRLSIKNINFTDEEDGTSTMSFDASIEEEPIDAD